MAPSRFALTPLRMARERERETARERRERECLKLNTIKTLKINNGAAKIFKTISIVKCKMF